MVLHSFSMHADPGREAFVPVASRQEHKARVARLEEPELPNSPVGALRG